MAQIIIGIPQGLGRSAGAVPYRRIPHASGKLPLIAGDNPLGKGKDLVVPPNTPKVTFVSESGSVIRVPFAPSEMQLDKLSPVYATIERPGKQELLVWQRNQLPQVTLTIFIAAENQKRNPLGSVERWISNFRKHIQDQTRWKFQYGPQVEKNWWRFTDVSIKTQLRTPDTNEIAVATADIQLTRANDINIRVGPVTGGVPPNKNGDKKTGASTYTKYTIKSASDTLWALAQRFLGDGNRWPEIAKLNNISDPRTIKIGQVLKIPGKSS